MSLTQVAIGLNENKNKLLSQTTKRTNSKQIKIKEKYKSKKLKCRNNRGKCSIGTGYSKTKICNVYRINYIRFLNFYTTEDITNMEKR